MAGLCPVIFPELIDPREAQIMIGLLNFFQNLLDRTRGLDFLAPLAVRA